MKVGANEHYLAFDGPRGTVFVAPRCSVCGLFIKTGNAEVNNSRKVRFSGWTCKRHGPTAQPIDWFWGEYDSNERPLRSENGPPAP